MFKKFRFWKRLYPLGKSIVKALADGKLSMQEIINILDKVLQLFNFKEIRITEYSSEELTIKFKKPPEIKLYF